MAGMGSKMLERHIAILAAMKGKSVEAGWFESDRYPSGPDGGPGRSVAANARLQEYGGVIDHPGGTKYIRDAIVGGRFVGTRFVKKDFAGEHEVTGPYKIVIPARPFMRYAWTLFSQQRSNIQKKIAKQIFEDKISAAQALSQIGLAMQGCIVKSIKTGPWEPNSKATASKKGFNKPLIDSAHMMQSVSSQVI